VTWARLSGFSKYGIKGPSPTVLDGKPDTGADAALPIDAAKSDTCDAAAPVDAAKPDLLVSDSMKPLGGTIVYVSTASHNGKFGGRSGLDSFCKSKMPGGLKCANVHALISVSASDEIRDMPTGHGYATAKPMYWYNGATKQYSKFADSWGDMLDGTIAKSRLAGTGIDALVWTGSDNNGGFHSSSRFHCLGWTSSWGTLAWNGGHTLKGNDNSGIAAVPDRKSNWLQTYSTTPGKHKHGPKTCCYFGTPQCPCSCPAAGTTTQDRLLCSNPARVMCAC